MKKLNSNLKKSLKRELGAGASLANASSAGGKTVEAQAGKGLLDLVWRVEQEGRRAGTWWWWFWLFFFENKENPLQPRQLMILWSTKDDDEIECNGQKLKLREDRVKTNDNGALLDGVVAAWYYDGKRMHEDFLLEHADVKIDSISRELRCGNSGSKTKFFQDGEVLRTVIEKGAGKKGSLKLDFGAKLVEGNDFAIPSLKVKKFVGGKFDYRIMRVNRADLSCKITQNGKTEASKGTAYFQKVMVNAPAVPWHWAIVHFANGSSLSYFTPHVGLSMLESNLLSGVATQAQLSKINKRLSKELLFFDAKSRTLHSFRNVKVRAEKNAAGLPAWRIKAHNGAGETLSLGLNSYSSAVWKFRKKIASLPVKSTLHYNEYPVHADQFELKTASGKTIRLKDVGEGFGNAEHAWGFLI